MREEFRTFNYEKASLHYSKRGEGKDVLISFHGYGQSNLFFRSLDKTLSEKYTIYGFDLFYHGKSFWHSGEEVLSKEFWQSLLHEFLKTEGIQSFSVLGFSMGGKFALATLESFPKQINNLYLIAPDGVKPNLWYELATRSIFFRFIFKKIVKKPDPFYRLLKKMDNWNLLPKKVIKFADYQMSTPEQRRRVYYSWVVFRDLRFNIDKVTFLIRKNNIKLEMFLGKYDKIITSGRVRKLINQVPDSHLYIINSGHSNLIEAVADFYNKKHEK